MAPVYKPPTYIYICYNQSFQAVRYPGHTLFRPRPRPKIDNIYVLIITSTISAIDTQPGVDILYGLSFPDHAWTHQDYVQGLVHKQSQVNYNELDLQFKSISSNFIGWICLQAHSYLAWLCLWTMPRNMSVERSDSLMYPTWRIWRTWRKPLNIDQWNCIHCPDCPDYMDIFVGLTLRRTPEKTLWGLWSILGNNDKTDLTDFYLKLSPMPGGGGHGWIHTHGKIHEMDVSHLHTVCLIYI